MNGLSKRRTRKLPMAEINVVPYIDVMLVLLVIFMITTPLLSQGVKVDLPRASAQPLATKEKEPVIVSVDASGNFYLNIAADPSQPIAPNVIADRVSQELLQAKQQGESRTVLVKGDRVVNYGKIMQAMVILQQAGATSVGLMTEQPNAS